MLKKTTTYTDFDGNERTETHYFNLTQTELTEFVIGMPEGLVESMDVQNVDREALAVKVLEKIGSDGALKFLKELVLKSYGIKSEDGRRFIKKPELTEEFSQTLVFDAMIIEFMQDEEVSAKFIDGVMPQALLDKMATIMPGVATLPGN